MICPKCSGRKAIKSGVIKGRQRYKCKDCNCHYTINSRERTPLAIRLECINLYLEGKSMREIGRSLDVHHTTVSRWLKNLGEDIKLFREK